MFIYTQRNITQPLKRTEILPFVTAWMDLEGIMLSEISQTEKDKNPMISNDIWNLKKKIAELVRQKISRVIDAEN